MLPDRFKILMSVSCLFIVSNKLILIKLYNKDARRTLNTTLPANKV